MKLVPDEKEELMATKTVYTTKYALTLGIQIGTYIPGEHPGNYIYVRFPGKKTYGLGQQCKLGVDAFPDKGQAEHRARRMAEKKIASLKKQLEAMEKLSEQPKWSE